MLLAAASLLSVGLVGANTLSKKDHQTQEVDNTHRNTYPQQIINMPQHNNSDPSGGLVFPSVPNAPPPPYSEDYYLNN